MKSIIPMGDRVMHALLAIQKRQKRSYIARFGGSSLNVAAFVFLTALGLAAVFADFIASDQPLAYGTSEGIHILPGRFGMSNEWGMRTEDIDKIVQSKNGWALMPPVPFGPNQTVLRGSIHMLEAPNRQHWLGTDDKGRDVLARVIHGSRAALLVGLGSVSLYLLVAILIGAIAGYFGGFPDRLALRLIETFSSFPTFFLILALQGLFGTSSLFQLVLIIGLTRWTDVARLTRAEVLRVANEDYVAAARALGLGNAKILFRHVLPGAMEPAFVAATFGAAGAILIESTLSFLGFGAPPTTPSWGQLITDGFYNEGCYWLTILPGLLLFLTILSINIVGEGLRTSREP